MMTITRRGPAFRWFAWYPVVTEDRGLRWLRYVNRRRIWFEVNDHFGSYYVTSVKGF